MLLFVKLLAFVTLLSPAFTQKMIVMQSAYPLIHARIDPLIAPGTFSQHSHRVVGGSAFDRTYNPDKLLQSKCSTLPVQADMSNYWHPQIFRALDNGSFVGLSGNTRIYYTFPPKLGPGQKLYAFPKGFQMVAGNPYRKTLTDFSNADIATYFTCYTYENPYGVSTYTLPTTPCVVLSSKVYFPSCAKSNSVFKVADQAANLAYPTWSTGGLWGQGCPANWNVRYPIVEIETYHFDANMPAKTKDTKVQYILANGDTTGYGLHGDFTNGWQPGFLEHVVTNCTNPSVQEPANVACPGIASAKFPYSTDAAAKCVYQGTVPGTTSSKLEQVGFGAGGALKTLPGCNLVWGATGAKPTCGVDPNAGKGWFPYLARYLDIGSRG